MNTRKILLVSSDKELISVVEISALTLTKLNCQVSIEEAADYESAVDTSDSENLDLIIIDNDSPQTDSTKLINEIRKNPVSKNKKIILLHTDAIDKDKIFEAGCDSIMSKEEFKRVVNNVLVF